MLEERIKNAQEKQAEQTRAYAPEGQCDTASGLPGGPVRQLGGEEANALRRKLREREDKLRAELRDVRRAIELINDDPSVQKVLEVISVANRA